MKISLRSAFQPNRSKSLSSAVVLVLATGIAVISNAAVIPTSRMANWSSAGVVGGIPTDRTEWTNAVSAGCDNTGVNDCSSILQSLGNNCPSGQYIYLPAGTYKVSSTIGAGYWNNRSLVGAGMGKTILHFTGGAYIFAGNGDWPQATNNVVITGGSLAGSANLTIDSTIAKITTTGKLVTITQVNPEWVHYNTNYYAAGPSTVGHGKDRLMAFTTRCLTKSATGITVLDPLPTDFTNAPMITPWNQYLLSGFGIEGLTLDMTNSSATFPVWFLQAYNCWIKNVEIEYPASRYAYFQECSHCSFVDNFTHNSRLSGPNSEGVDFAENDCYCLIQNNVCDNAGFGMIILGDYGGGCAGNVIAYNFLTNAVSGSTVAGNAISLNHGPHNMFNLVEGNVCQNIMADGYYGSASHNTLFRNWFTGFFNVSDYSDGYCIGLMHWQRWFNVVGNVLGTPGYSKVLYAAGGSYQDGIIYKAGYPNMGNRSADGVSADNPSDANAFDTGVTNTWINTGNYDFVDNSTVWDASGVQTIPNSLYLTAKPSWWDGWGTTPWPPIGPDAGRMTNAIPAQLRFMQLMDGGSGGTPLQPPTVLQALQPGPN